MRLVSDLLVYRCMTMLKPHIPVKTGNMKHNATGLFYIGFDEAAYGIDPSEATYAPEVLELYQLRGDDFMKKGLIDAYELLNFALNGGNPSYNQKYLVARENALSTAESTIDREIQNREFGTGRYAGKSIYR